MNNLLSNWTYGATTDHKVLWILLTLLQICKFRSPCRSLYLSFNRFECSVVVNVLVCHRQSVGEHSPPPHPLRVQPININMSSYRTKYDWSCHICPTIQRDTLMNV